MITLLFLPDGTVQGLYTEAIELATLGRLRIQRATTIEFDHPLQAWRVFDARGRGVYCSPSRQTCLDWERQHLNWVLENP
jgi:hypothetical protein